ncbi:uncharacterized protein BDR25DRAFT_223303 [Lindgomyces ingoldianus]|uniref:Uncharacterized protein n=1 Tax=Lindgomyces ingoldianus TaxID=673940 RepID=A0ACB6QXB1_9PLEO|nr:uncharacterized protein BDR25DRAFT_223303 [Lindgomyces ingoldianus]KAF2471203.1 hypothetical protein BDR25DRAFT_223303 [Lindgomyces ingoldianus]
MNSLNSRRDTTEHAPDEETPLLGEPSDGSRPWRRLRKHMTVNISKSWADCILLFGYVITGLLDSSAVFIWGAFVSMQTGNTVYLGLGLVEPAAGIRWIKSLVSITFFCLGSFFFSRFHRFFSPRQRWVLVASYSIQLLLIVLAAVIASIGNGLSNGLHWQVLVPLASVAFQASGQAVTSRVLQYGGLTSVVLTSNCCDLFSDPNLVAASNVERNRRAAAPILLLLGAIFGGLFAHSSVGLAGALWTAVVLKTSIIISWLLWATEPEEDG